MKLRMDRQHVYKLKPNIIYNLEADLDKDEEDCRV